MKNQLTLFAFVFVMTSALSAFGQLDASGQQDNDSYVVHGYKYASVSKGKLSSSTITFDRLKGKAEKIENSESVYLLKTVIDSEELVFTEFFPRFKLPKTTSNLKAIVEYKTTDKAVEGRVRWNGNFLSDNPDISDAGNNPNQILKKEFLLDNFNVDKENTFEVVPSEGTLQIQTIKILYNYHYTFTRASDELLKFHFNLPQNASDVKAVVTYNVTEKGIQGRIRLNEKYLSDNSEISDSGVKPGLVQKEFPLKDLVADNILEVIPSEYPFQILHVVISYKLPPISVFTLASGEKLSGRFKLPKTASDVKAIVTYNVTDKGVKGLVRWNKKEASEISETGKITGLVQKEIPLNEFKWDEDNVFEIIPSEGLFQILSIKILYNYQMPCCVSDDVMIKLISPNPDFDAISSDLTLKWKGIGACGEGYVTLKYKDGSAWKPVPGAEAFSVGDKEWQNQFSGQFVWKNHGLKKLPDLKIDFIKGANSKKEEANRFFEEAKKLFNAEKYIEAKLNLEEALKLYPDEKEYREFKKTIGKQFPFSSYGKEAGDRVVISINGVEYAFRWIPAGTYTIGSPKSERGRNNDETQHQVTLTQGFLMLETEITQKQWQTVMGNNPSDFKGDNLPVERVTWKDCQDFCKKLSAYLNFSVKLPTEAQWEYACRAGTSEPYADALDDMAWHHGNSKRETHPVATKAPNAWGLYDMLGNVWEWCQDFYGNYSDKSVTDPTGAQNGGERVLRGGSWFKDSNECRSASRNKHSSGYRNNNLGFRIVIIPND